MSSSELYESETLYSDSSRSSSASDINSCSYWGNRCNLSSMFLSYLSIAWVSVLQAWESSESFLFAIWSIGMSSFTIVPSKLVALILTMFLWSQSAKMEISLYIQYRVMSNVFSLLVLALDCIKMLPCQYPKSIILLTSFVKGIMQFSSWLNIENTVY